MSWVRSETIERWNSIQSQDLLAPDDRKGGGKDLRIGQATSEAGGDA